MFKIGDKIVIKPWVRGYHKDYHKTVFKVYTIIIMDNHLVTETGEVFYLTDCMLATECQELLYG